MRTPIAYGLGWPDRLPTPAARLDLTSLGQLTFFAPDPKRFPALDLARQALQWGGAAPTILNAANEVAVRGFLQRRIGFLDIARIVDATLDKIPNRQCATLDDVRTTDQESRRIAEMFVA
jgi:1-deoxy-D-xylulose-5-phosphate reductoisomerase